MVLAVAGGLLQGEGEVFDAEARSSFTVEARESKNEPGTLS